MNSLSGSTFIHSKTNSTLTTQYRQFVWLYGDHLKLYLTSSYGRSLLAYLRLKSIMWTLWRKLVIRFEK